MITIKDLNSSPVLHHNRTRTMNGVVRAIYASPFPHFLLEDATGVLVCQSINTMPNVGSHIEVTGEFFVGVPENCSVQMTILKEQKWSYLGHLDPCGITGCEFEKEMPPSWTSLPIAA